MAVAADPVNLLCMLERCISARITFRCKAGCGADLLHLVVAIVLQVVQHACEEGCIAKQRCSIRIQQLQQSVERCAGLLSCARAQM